MNEIQFYKHLMTEKDIKSFISVKKLILTSKEHAKHPFASRNTQHLGFIKLRLTMKALYTRYTQARLRTLKFKTDIKPLVKSLSAKCLFGNNDDFVYFDARSKRRLLCMFDCDFENSYILKSYT